jgi:hypothetical protein
VKTIKAYAGWLGSGVTHWRATLTLSVVAVCCGCGPGGSDVTTVRGKITVNGAAVSGGLINFLAAGARPAGGGINADGTYEFDLPPGEYQVRIDTPPALPAGYKEGDPLPVLPPRQVPEKYASFATSGLTAKVAAQGEQTIDFSLP